MAQFTTKVEFSAFQFNPEALARVGEYDLEDFVEAEFADNDVTICYAKVKNSSLHVSLFWASELGGKTFVMEPTDWLVYFAGTFKVMNDADFQEFASPV